MVQSVRDVTGLYPPMAPPYPPIFIFKTLQVIICIYP
jgi:hypothetical protein